MKKKIGLGTWSWGNKLFWNYNPNNDGELRKVFLEACKRGFSIIDTADSYGTGKLNGQSEILIGNFLQELTSTQRKKIKIATKLAPYPWRLGKTGFNKPFLNSLERLDNKLDIVQLHWSTSKYNPSQEYQLLENLCNLSDQGYDFDIGLSNFGPKRLEKLINFLSIKTKKIKCVQVQFSLLSPEIHKQRMVKKICESYNINFLAYSPLSFGLLCQDPLLKRAKDRSILRNYIFKIYDQSTIELRYLLKEIAQKRSVSLAQVAINWCCYQGAIPIIGIRKKSQVIDISNVFNWNLTSEEFKRLEIVSKECLKKLPSNPFNSN